MVTLLGNLQITFLIVRLKSILLYVQREDPSKAPSAFKVAMMRFGYISSSNSSGV